MSDEVNELPEGVYFAPYVTCKWCGVDAECINGIEQPHRCRIEVP